MNLSDLHKDAIAEVINIGVGQSAESLNMMLNDRIHLDVPKIDFIEMDQLEMYKEKNIDESQVMVYQSFSGGFKGRAGLVFPYQSAETLVSSLTGQEPTSAEMDAVRAGTLSEVGNIVLSGLFSSIGNYVGGNRFNFSIANFSDDVGSLIQVKEEEDEDKGVYILAEVNFSFENLSIQGHIVIFFTIQSLNELIKLIDEKLGL